MTKAAAQMSPSELRKFGLVTGLLLIVFFDGLIPWIWGIALPLWPLIVAAVLGLLALVFPKGLAPIYRVWMAFANVLGWINTRIILSLIFFLVFLPVGLVVRALSDPMRRKLDGSVDSYRIPSNAPKPENMERPF